MANKTIEVSRWVNVYGRGNNFTYDCKEAALRNAGEGLIETVELKGSYEIEILEKSVTITESELERVIRTCILDNVFVKSRGERAIKARLADANRHIFGGGQ